MVFVVDDDASVRDAIKDLLESAGIGVLTFDSGRDFLAAQRVDAPSCLILDVRLPGMSGLELQQQLATAQCRIPIVFVSAHDDPAFRRQALQSGAFAFLGKPVNDEALLEAIRSAIKPGKPK